jgi:hypothetical protein
MAPLSILEFQTIKEDLRETQWRPDGKAVSFVYRHGLYVMPVSDKSATVRNRANWIRSTPGGEKPIVQVEPEIHLPSVGMDVDIAYFYNSSTLVGTPLINGAYGYMRTLSHHRQDNRYGSPATGQDRKTA